MNKLKERKPVRIYRYFLGLEQAIHMAGLRPNVDLYVPSAILSDEENKVQCALWWKRAHYQAERAQTGVYRSQEERKERRRDGLTNERAAAIVAHLAVLDKQKGGGS